MTTTMRVMDCIKLLQEQRESNLLVMRVLTLMNTGLLTLVGGLVGIKLFT